MRCIHPVAWAGFLMNCVLAYITIGDLQNISPELLQQFIGPELQAADVIAQMRQIFLTFLLFQAIALGVLCLHARIGLLLGVITGLVMLPISMVFIVGIILSFYALRYSNYETAPRLDPSLGFVVPNGNIKKMCYTSIALFVFGAVNLMVANMLLGSLFIVAGPLLLYLVVRARSLPPLGVFSDFIAIVPGAFAKSIKLNYSDIRSATLLADETVQFHVSGNGSLQSITWPLATIAPEQRKEAVQKIAEALTNHGVTLL